MASIPSSAKMGRAEMTDNELSGAIHLALDLAGVPGDDPVRFVVEALHNRLRNTCVEVELLRAENGDMRPILEAVTRGAWYERENRDGTGVYCRDCGVGVWP